MAERPALLNVVVVAAIDDRSSSAWAMSDDFRQDSAKVQRTALTKTWCLMHQRLSQLGKCVLESPGRCLLHQLRGENAGNYG